MIAAIWVEGGRGLGGDPMGRRGWVNVRISARKRRETAREDLDATNHVRLSKRCETRKAEYTP